MRLRLKFSEQFFSRPDWWHVFWAVFFFGYQRLSSLSNTRTNTQHTHIHSTRALAPPTELNRFSNEIDHIVLRISFLFENSRTKNKVDMPIDQKTSESTNTTRKKKEQKQQTTSASGVGAEKQQPRQNYQQNRLKTIKLLSDAYTRWSRRCDGATDT